MFRILLVKLKIFTPWQDVKTFTHGDSNYLMQGKRNLITNSAKFRTIRLGGLFTVSTTIETISHKIPQIPNEIINPI